MIMTQVRQILSRNSLIQYFMVHAERSEVDKKRRCHGCLRANDKYNRLKEIWKLEAWSTLAFKVLVLVCRLLFVHFQALSLKLCMHRRTSNGSVKT